MTLNKLQLLVSIVLILISSCLISSCSNEPAKNSTTTPSKKIQSQDNIKLEIKNLAESLDKTLVDGWYFGAESRTLKSSYRKVPAELKADFAIAYQKMLEERNQNMARNFESYVPYSARYHFANEWWQKKDPQYLQENFKYRLLWCHEALMDASELYFRAQENMRGSDISSVNAIAHDEEQKLVSKYAEDTHSHSTFSKHYGEELDKIKNKNKQNNKD